MDHVVGSMPQGLQAQPRTVHGKADSVKEKSNFYIRGTTQITCGKPKKIFFLFSQVKNNFLLKSHSDTSKSVPDPMTILQSSSAVASRKPERNAVGPGSCVPNRVILSRHLRFGIKKAMDDYLEKHW